MSRLSELMQKLADQKLVVNDLAAQADRSKAGDAQRLLRKRETVVLAVQATQNDIDEVLHRVAYLRVAHIRAQENLTVIERQITTAAATDPLRAVGLAGGRTTALREIDGILREIAKLDPPQSQA